MPYIETKTTATITEEKEAAIRAKLGEAIRLIPGKSEQWLMLSFFDNCRMAFRGKSDLDLAMVEVKLFGAADDRAYAALTRAVTDILSDELCIPHDHIYVKYEEVAHWGYDGYNF